MRRPLSFWAVGVGLVMAVPGACRAGPIFTAQDPVGRSRSAGDLVGRLGLRHSAAASGGARHEGGAHRRRVCRKAEAGRTDADDGRQRGRIVPQRQRLADALVPADVAHRRSAGRPRAGAGARRRHAAHAARHLRQRSARRSRRFHAVRPLHHARRRGLDDAKDLRQRLPHRAGARLRRDHVGDDSRSARHPARRPAARGRRRARRISATRAATGTATRS